MCFSLFSQAIQNVCSHLSSFSSISWDTLLSRYLSISWLLCGACTCLMVKRLRRSVPAYHIASSVTALCLTPTVFYWIFQVMLTIGSNSAVVTAEKNLIHSTCHSLHPSRNVGPHLDKIVAPLFMCSLLAQYQGICCSCMGSTLHVATLFLTASFAWCMCNCLALAAKAPIGRGQLLFQGKSKTSVFSDKGGTLETYHYA